MRDTSVLGIIQLRLTSRSDFWRRHESAPKHRRGCGQVDRTINARQALPSWLVSAVINLGRRVRHLLCRAQAAPCDVVGLFQQPRTDECAREIRTPMTGSHCVETRVSKPARMLFNSPQHHSRQHAAGWPGLAPARVSSLFAARIAARRQ